MRNWRILVGVTSTVNVSFHLGRYVFFWISVFRAGFPSITSSTYGWGFKNEWLRSDACSTRMRIVWNIFFFFRVWSELTRNLKLMKALIVGRSRRQFSCHYPSWEDWLFSSKVSDNHSLALMSSIMRHIVVDDEISSRDDYLQGR